MGSSPPDDYAVCDDGSVGEGGVRPAFGEVTRSLLLEHGSNFLALRVLLQRFALLAAPLV